MLSFQLELDALREERARERDTPEPAATTGRFCATYVSSSILVVGLLEV